MIPNKDHLVATFSIVGYDPVEKEWGVAVQSKFLGVGALVPWAKAGVGAIATQSWCNTSFGPEGLKLLEEGLSAEKVLEKLLENDEQKEYRQVGIVDAEGKGATFTGKECFNWAGGIAGENFACQGNILVNPETVEALADTFKNTKGDLAERLVAALDSAQSAGGDSRGKQSAALLVVKEKGGYGGFNDRYIDLRVDDHVEPIKELKRLLDLYRLYFYKTKPGNLVKIEGKLISEIKEELKKTGYFEGEVDEKFDEQFKAGLKRFYLTENFDERYREDDNIDIEVLAFLRELAKKSE
ncbi:DUF1028 domain-containing protein [Clostridium folliculivorans]|uniref:Putative peptidoglycan binding domain-containing protein n=1 Tax=Clostridium folliculivorans TaxID=2886038 RepID=A0A9W5XZZ8_9CLOT|nr:DUF1028 domain-containing protein [Clostridium folliculivorans]GKU24026.1 hypothetical protein CFOLD11_08520 [Clostridium folliculivorans]GKU30141.1 hypothetical protein CFB3_22480 [Clostridium folliculivorans]